MRAFSGLALSISITLFASPAFAGGAVLEATFEGVCPDLDRNRAIVSCVPEGGARVYRYRSAAGVWQLEQSLTQSDVMDPGTLEGPAVIEGRIAAVGGRIDGTVLGSEPGGAVYVFRRNNGIWEQEAKLTASDWEPFPVCDVLEIGNGFGDALSLDGNRLAIGARTDCERGEFAGAVYVFRRKTDGTWVEEAKLVGSATDATDQFGWSVSLDGTTLVAGGPLARVRGPRIGSAYVFTRSGRQWAEEVMLPRSGTLTAEDFGVSVAVEGNTILVGANRDDDRGELSGSVYYYEKLAGVWTESGKLLAQDGRTKDRFGSALALEGSRALVGSIGDDDNVPNSGSVYMFTKDDGRTWRQARKLTAPDGKRQDRFGSRVSLSGSRALAAASGAGAAYVFSLDTPSGGESVAIDFEPGKPANRIDPTTQKRFRVAVFSDAGFDALQIDLASVRLAPGGATPLAHRVEDTNDDGLIDLVFVFESASAGLACGESTIELTGRTAVGNSFTGSDTVINTSCP